MEPVCLVGAGVVVPGCEGIEDLWRRAQDGPPAFGFPDRCRSYEALSSAGPDEPGRAAYDLRFGEVAATSATGSIDGQASFERGDLQVSWLRRCLTQCLSTTTEPAPHSRSALFLAASTEANHELDAALAADMVLDGMVERLPAGRPEARNEIRQLLQEADPCAASPHGKFLPHKQAERAVHGILPEDTPILVVDNICPSGLYAVDLGVKHLLDGSVDIAFCGGMSSHGPLRQVYFSEMGALSTSGRARAFDAEADGTLFSEGAAVVVLKRLSDALRDNDTVLTLLAGFGGASDGKSKAIFAPSQEGQTRAMIRARSVNNVPGAQVAWIVGHGTATRAGDTTELHSIAAAHPDGTPWVTSNKPLLGHTGMPCGIVSLIQAAMGLHRSTVPRQPNHKTLPEHALALPVRIPSAPEPLMPTATSGEPPFAGVFACGLGGINGYQLLRSLGSGPHDVSSSPPSLCDELALVSWTALVPGRADDSAVAARLSRGDAPSQERRFESPYPIPSFKQSLIIPQIAAQLDMSQLLAIELVSRLGDAGKDHLWEGLEERIGIFGARYGPSQSAADSAVRCLGSSLVRSLDETAAQEAADAYLREHAAKTRPVGPYSLVGRMSSAALGWVANRRDFHGPTMMVDAGLASGLAALHTASCYLRRGEVDLALVLAWNAGCIEQAAQSLGISPHEIAEGAFAIALARPETARERGWRVHARVHTDFRAERTARDWSQQPSYLAADGLVAVLRAVLEGEQPQRFGGAAAPSVSVLPGPEGG
nr:beta-ketoacyl synthase N-terminal-like domain-containing protein [Saccharopolyspora sp. ASAGF58]